MALTLEEPSITKAVRSLSPRSNAFINGRFVPAVSGKVFTTENPAHGKPLAEIAACDGADVDRAVSAARAAFSKGSWSRESPSARKKLLLRFADLIERHDAELALL